MNYETALKMVQAALRNGDEITYDLAVAFTGERDDAIIEQMVAEQFHQAANGVDDFDLSVVRYLYDMLDNEEGPHADSMKVAGTFETVEQAEQNGFYWDDTIDRWLKL